MAYKVPPYIPTRGEFSYDESFTEEDVLLLKEWGFNFIRYSIIWEAVEKERGVYDDAYLDQINDHINMIGKHGIRVLLDNH